MWCDEVFNDNISTIVKSNINITCIYSIDVRKHAFHLKEPLFLRLKYKKNNNNKYKKPDFISKIIDNFMYVIETYILLVK
jgi:hypothetical protein